MRPASASNARPTLQAVSRPHSSSAASLRGARPNGVGYRPSRANGKLPEPRPPPSDPSGDAQQRGANPKEKAALLFKHALVQHDRGDFNSAISLFNRAIRLNASEASYYSSRALSYRKVNRWNEAISDYTTSRRIEQRGGAGQNVAYPHGATPASSFISGEQFHIGGGFLYMLSPCKGCLARLLLTSLHSTLLDPTCTRRASGAGCGRGASRRGRKE